MEKGQRKTTPLLLCSHIVVLHLLSLVAETSAKVSAVIVFGDSSVDAGNNNFIPTIARSNFQPYGRDFEGGKATGRFCNGRIPTDFISESFGLKPYVPAYLDPKYNISDFASGVTFASAATGYDNATSDVLSVIPLWKQLEYYKGYQKNLSAYLGESKAKDTIAEALHLMSLGTNDFLENYYTMPGRASQFTPQQYQNFLAGIAENFIRSLYGLGARKVSLGGLPPMGCLPLERTTSIAGGNDCVARYNNIALEFNNRLKNLTIKLNQELPGLKLVFSNPYYIMLSIIKRPQLYGFESTSVACCATGMFEMGYACSRGQMFSCTDASKYVFWDSFHPTEMTNSIVAKPGWVILSQAHQKQKSKRSHLATVNTPTQTHSKRTLAVSAVFATVPSPSMESLFGSINVRDLLSAQDLSDPNSPLSAPDLRLLIQRLESQSFQIRSQVQSYLVSHHEDFARLFSLCNDTVSQTREVSDDVSAILGLLSDHPIDAEVREIVSETKSKKEELKMKKELLGLVGTVVALNQRLESVREALKSGRFEFAAQGLKELKVALRIGDEDDREPLVYGLLRKEWSQCFEEIQEVLVNFMEKAVRFDGDLNQVEIKYHLEVENVNGIQLQTVLEAMDVVGILEYGLAKVADLMIKYVITPFVNHGRPLSFLEELHQELALLKIVPSPDSKFEYLDGEFLYSGILLFIKFIYRSICFQKSSWMRCFGRLTWPRISELIISSFLSKVVPTDASKLPDFQKIIACTSKFEMALKELMYISESDDKDNRLSNFAENVEVHFAFKKKTEILANARNLLLECDFSIPQEYTRDGSVWKSDETSAQSSSHVVDLLFLSQRCLVSKAAKQLMELVHQTLQDVCLSSTRVAFEFYHTARDAVLLYEVVVPVKLERQLNGINQVAILLHNDCLYLSQEILGFAFEYRTDFPSSMKEHAVFVDLAPRFQLLAEEILQRQVHLVIYNLKEAIDGADGFQNTHQMKQFESAKFSIDQVVFILEKVHIIWEPLLLPSTYRRSMCTVLESVFSRIARDILLLDDIAAEETLQLQRLIYLMLENLSSLFESLAPGEQNLHEFPAESLEDLIPSLRKIRKLSELLDMPLKSITAYWENKELLSCGFTITEVEDFIKAIFTDSPLRKDCLWRIQNASI